MIKNMLSRLKKPSVILSVLSQILSILLLFGFDIDQNLIIAIATVMCSILVTLGILSNPDTENKWYKDDILTCSNNGKRTRHVKINGKMVCTLCGAVYKPAEPEQAPEAPEALREPLQ